MSLTGRCFSIARRRLGSASRIRGPLQQATVTTSAAAAILPTRTLDPKLHHHHPPRPRRVVVGGVAAAAAAAGGRCSSTATGPEKEQTTTPTASPPPTPPPPKIYTYEDIVALTTASPPDKTRILIDVRERSEIAETGRIPGSENVPIQTAPDFAFVDAAEFETRFGFPRPTAEQEVVFYCKAGVRSRAAARLAREGRFGGPRVGEFPGSWGEWVARGGEVERD